MKLSLPVINTIRFDTELNLVVNRTEVQSTFTCDGYCVDGTDELGNYRYGVGIRIRLTFYVDKPINEVAGYLSETESTVLTHSTPEEDLSMLNRFSRDVFRNIKNNLQRALPSIDLNHLDFPDPEEVSSSLSDGLKQMGLYS